MNGNKKFYRFVCPLAEVKKDDRTLIESEPKELEQKIQFYIETCERLKEEGDRLESFQQLSMYEHTLWRLAEKAELDIIYFMNALTGRKNIKGFFYPRPKVRIVCINLVIGKNLEKFETVNAYMDWANLNHNRIKHVTGIEIVYQKPHSEKRVIFEHSGKTSVNRLNEKLLQLITLENDEI